MAGKPEKRLELGNELCGKSERMKEDDRGGFEIS